ncbi:hypothetical protein ID866_3699 [Astraeus odoratus]|nr:hypothetical protein ID866_3699 [Astraeus odoratus]
MSVTSLSRPASPTGSARLTGMPGQTHSSSLRPPAIVLSTIHPITLRSQEGYESTSSSSRPSRSRTRVPTYADQSRQLDHRERELRQPPSRHRSQSHSRTPPSQSTIQTAYPQRTTQSYSYPQHHVTSGSHPHYYRNPGPAVYPYPTGRGSTPPRTAYTAPPPGHVYYPSHGGQPYNQSRDQLHRGYPQSRQPSRNQPPSYHTVPASGPKPENRRAVRPTFSHVLLLVLIVHSLFLRMGFGFVLHGHRFNPDFDEF